MLQPVPRRHNRANFVKAAEVLAPVAAFPFFGTLLGLVREGDLIRNDDDVDFYVDLRHRPRVIELLGGAGFSVDLGAPANLTPWFLQATRSIDGTETYLDIYFYESAEHLPWIVERWNFLGAPHREEQHLHIDKRLIFPLKRRTFLGVDVWLPARPRKCCALLYGPQWREKCSKHRGEYQIVIHCNQPHFVRRNDLAYELAQRMQDLSARLDVALSAVAQTESEKAVLSVELQNLQQSHAELVAQIAQEASSMVGPPVSENMIVELANTEPDPVEMAVPGLVAEPVTSDNDNTAASSMPECAEARARHIHLQTARDEISRIMQAFQRRSGNEAYRVGLLESGSACESLDDAVTDEECHYVRSLYEDLQQRLDRDSFEKCLLTHFAERIQRAEGETLIRHGFDVAFYLESNPDVRDAGVDPVEHFVRHGREERRPIRFQAA